MSDVDRRFACVETVLAEVAGKVEQRLAHLEAAVSEMAMAWAHWMEGGAGGNTFKDCIFGTGAASAPELTDQIAALMRERLHLAYSEQHRIDELAPEIAALLDTPPAPPPSATVEQIERLIEGHYMQRDPESRADSWQNYAAREIAALLHG